MARRRSNFSKRRGGSSSAPYVLGAVIALGLLGGAGWWSCETAATMAVDEATLCPKATGPLAETAILFDLTDPLAPAQSAQLRQYLESEFAQAPQGTQFTMGVVAEDQALWGATDPLCKPASAEEVSSVTQNVALVAKRYQDRFLAPLQANLDRMISASSAKTSPIMESLQALVAATPGFLTFQGPRRLILVSDLLQNSDAMSFYRGEDWQAFPGLARLRAAGADAGRGPGRNLRRPARGRQAEGPGRGRDFWLRYFELQGAGLPRSRSLGDL